MDKTQKGALGFLGRIVLGKESPGAVRKLLFWIGLAGSIYFLTWFSFMYLAVVSQGDVSDADQIRAIFTALGERYQVDDMLLYVEYYSLTGIGVFVLSLLSLVLIWRKVKVGYLMYSLSFLLAAVAGIFFLSFKGFLREVSWFDQTLYLAYFGVFLVFHFLQRKNLSQMDRMEKKVDKLEKSMKAN